MSTALSSIQETLIGKQQAANSTQTKQKWGESECLGFPFTENGLVSFCFLLAVFPLWCHAMAKGLANVQHQPNHFWQDLKWGKMNEDYFYPKREGWNSGGECGSWTSPSLSLFLRYKLMTPWLWFNETFLAKMAVLALSIWEQRPDIWLRKLKVMGWLTNRGFVHLR